MLYFCIKSVQITETMEKKLRIENMYFQYLTLIAALLTLPFLKGTSQVSLTTLGAAYTQNFDGLANSGTSSSVPSGWAFLETGGNTLYTAGTGSSATGDTYSFGASAASDRAFGTLLSGSVTSTLGVSFTNNTGATITSLDISYVGEEWRLGTASRTDQLNFEYSLNATSLTSGTWTSVSALNFITPNTSAATGTINGNATGNKTSISSTINSLSIAVGGTVWIRWTDFNASGADDGLAVDDFTLTPSGAAPTPPTKLVITSITPTSPVAGSGFSVTVQAQDGNNIPQNVVANTAFSLSTNGNAGSIGGTITGTINAGSSSVVVSGVTLSTGGTNVNITATRTSGDALSAATSSTFTVIGLATQLAFVGVPSSGYVSSNIAAFTIEARRADNSVDVNYNGTISVAKAGGPGTLSGTTSVSAVSGVATFSVLQFDQVGTYSLSTTSGTLTSVTSSSIIISPSPVTWDFTTSSAANIPANLNVSVMSQGNNNGTTPLLDNSSVSSGYTGASGGNNAEAAARTGAINTGSNGSAYFEFTLTPNTNYIVTLNGISFGTRSTSTGPQAFSLRSSKDNYVSNIASGVITTGTWGLKSPSVTSISSNAGNPITFRIYGHSGTGSPGANTANWRIDDVLLNLTVSACTQPNISVNSGSICTGNSFTISPTGGVTYSVSGNSFTVNPTSNTNYTVTGADAIGCTNTAVSAVAVNTVPVVSVNSGAICAGSSFTISPSGASTYTISGGASIVSPSANTDYTVTGTSAQGCLSSNQAVSSVTVNAIPSVSANSGSICSGNSFTINPTGANTYAYSSGSNVVNPTTTSDYTVTGTSNGCSANAVLTVSVNSNPIINVNSGAICAGSSFTISPSGAFTYTISGGGASIVSPSANTDYTVTGTSAQGCLSSNQAVSSVTVNAIPTVSITGTSTVCSGYATSLTANGASTYVWSNGPTTAINNVIPTSNTTYSVIGTNGNGCTNTASINVTTFLCVPNTSLQATFCGTTLTSLSDKLKCLLVSGASKYEWEVTDMSTGIVYLKQSANNLVDMYLSYIPQVTYNRTYNIRVRAYSGGIWGVFSNACSVTTPLYATTKLQTAYCSSTLTSLSDRLKCDVVPSTTMYEWEVTDISTNTVYLKQSPNNIEDMYLSYIPQVTYNKTYSIRVRAYSGGVWNPFGTACNVTTPLNSTTKLQTVYCSSTLTALNNKLKCDVVPSTAMYEWEVTDVSTNAVYLKQSVNNLEDMYLSYIPQVTYNKTYSIRVRAYSAGVWGTFGTSCNVTTPPNVTTTKLQTAYCSSTLTALTNKLKCDIVPSTSMYEWEVTDISTNAVYLKQSANNLEDMYLSYIPQVTYNKTYNIRVRAYSAGVWGTFGQSCTVTTPASGARFAYINTEETEMSSRININAYPNPTSEILNIDFDNIPTDASVEIYNMVGELVLVQQLTEPNNTINTTSLANGLYHVKVIGNNKLLYAQKIVKQ